MSADAPSPGLAYMDDWMPNWNFLVDWPGRQDRAFKPELSQLKRDIQYSMVCLVLVFVT